MSGRISIAFFGHDAADAAIRRRIKSLQDDGLHVDGFMMRRDAPGETAWPNHDLGQTKAGAFFHRAFSILSGTRNALQHREILERADLFYARNMDMLAIAVRVKRRLKLDTPIVYECLDVHRLLFRQDLIGKLFRSVERRLLRASSALVVSSPAFLDHHFDRYYPGEFNPVLIENRLTDAFTGGDRPAPKDASATLDPDAPLKLGWVGILRCQRSLDLLCETARSLGSKVEIRIHGIPAENEVPRFHEQIAEQPNMRFFGRYKAPEDLSEIYGDLDLVWAGDFMEAGFNSVWLLPNRIYEGGFFATPAICPDQTQTANWIREHACGFAVPEPLETTFPDLLERLHQDRSQIQAYQTALTQLPIEVFVQPAGFLKTTIENVLNEHPSNSIARGTGSLRPIG